MLALSRGIIKRIEGLLEPGYYIQLEQVGNNCLVHKRPITEEMLQCPPAAATGDGRATLSLSVQTTGEDPVEIASWPIKEDCWVLGVLTSKTPN